MIVNIYNVTEGGEKIYPDEQSKHDNLSYKHALDKYWCNQCYYATPRLDKIVQHLKAHKGKWQCGLCGKAFIKVPYCQNCAVYVYVSRYSNYITYLI